jgi:SAM-dependent methyltransferase
MLGAARALHKRFVHGRRVQVLAKHFASLIPTNARVLDVGCGDGTIDSLIVQLRSDVRIEGIDVLVRPTTNIPVTAFDGARIPFGNKSFDAVMLVDVLHHTTDPLTLLREATRVGKSVLIKDHFLNGFLAKPTLSFMDWLGNAHHGVALPYNFWSRPQWDSAFEALGVTPASVTRSLGLYPVPASWLFERGFHFIAKLEHRGSS